MAEPKYIIEYMVDGDCEWRPLEDITVRMESPEHLISDRLLERVSVLRAADIRALFKAGAHFVTLGVTLAGTEKWVEVHCRLVTIIDRPGKAMVRRTTVIKGPGKNMEVIYGEGE